jgi:predicted DNA-binding transcriptional regulator AlpA
MPKLLDIRSIVELVPVSRITIWRWVKAGRFPAPLKVGNLTFWRAAEIEAFVAAPAPAPVSLTDIEADAER